MDRYIKFNEVKALRRAFTVSGVLAYSLEKCTAFEVDQADEAKQVEMGEYHIITNGHTIIDMGTSPFDMEIKFMKLTFGMRKEQYGQD
jgi:hypothetical protein